MTLPPSVEAGASCTPKGDAAVSMSAATPQKCMPSSADSKSDVDTTPPPAGRPRAQHGSPWTPASSMGHSPATTLDLFSKFATAGSPRLSDTLNRACSHIESTYLAGKGDQLSSTPRQQSRLSDGGLHNSFEIPEGSLDDLPCAAGIRVSPTESLKEALEGTLRSHTGNPSMQEAVCNMLSLLYRDQPEVTAEGGDATEMLQQLQAALRSHPGNPGLTKWACSAMAAYCAGHEENSNIARKLGLLTDVCKVLARFPTNLQVVDRACELICEMCDASFANRVAAGHVGLLTELQAVLAKNQGDPDITEIVANTVESICAGHKNNTWMALRMGLWEGPGNGSDLSGKVGAGIE